MILELEGRISELIKKDIRREQNQEMYIAQLSTSKALSEDN